MTLHQSLQAAIKKLAQDTAVNSAIAAVHNQFKSKATPHK